MTAENHGSLFPNADTKNLGMFGIHDLPLFVVACVLLAITPGPDTALVFARTLRHGRRGGPAPSLGLTPRLACFFGRTGRCDFRYTM
jgi:hypothetical protein